MKDKNSAARLIICCAAAVILTAAALIFTGYSLIGGADGWSFFSKIITVKKVIGTEYVGETDWNALADGAAAGMLDAVGDRWSYYMTASEYEAYADYSQNSTTGIGVSIEKDAETGGFTVISVTAASPAERAGIVLGQIIMSVAGQDVAEMDVSELRELVRAQTGAGEYEIVLKNTDGSVGAVTLSNEVIYTNPVSYKMLDRGIGYVRIINFEQGAAENGIAAIEALTGDGAISIVFDVRSNPGGRLSELVELLDYILPEGDLFISVDSDGSEKIYTSDESCIEMPMAVLLNSSSYSAAEFFAAALSEYGYAVTVGEASTGKARSQETFVLDDGSAVHISTRNYLTPNRVNLAEQGGLVPEIEVENSGENDAQLEAAIKSLS